MTSRRGTFDPSISAGTVVMGRPNEANMAPPCLGLRLLVCHGRHVLRSARRGFRHAEHALRLTRTA
ncbi:MAG: hypothetical protein ACC645_26295, partial [Pirellulales bacterium]